MNLVDGGQRAQQNLDGLGSTNLALAKEFSLSDSDSVYSQATFQIHQGIPKMSSSADQASNGAMKS